jgi:amino-acid N-acetyltransferase
VPSKPVETVIRRGGAPDRPAIEALLRAADLPLPDPSDPEVEFLVGLCDGEVVACAGWEIHDGHGLLRSVAVEPSLRARGIGRRLVRKAVDRLDRLGLTNVTLVTLDADRFFESLGFMPIDRDDVPAPVRSSPEFSAHRCLGGQWMQRDHGPLSA